MLHLTSVLRWQDSLKQVFGFPSKYIVAQGFWEPSSAAITGDNFFGIRLLVLWIKGFPSSPHLQRAHVTPNIRIG